MIERAGAPKRGNAVNFLMLVSASRLGRRGVGARPFASLGLPGLQGARDRRVPWPMHATRI